MRPGSHSTHTTAPLRSRSRPLTALIALATTIGLALTPLTATPASAAVDGNTGTRWSSTFSDPQWLTVDLGATATIGSGEGTPPGNGIPGPTTASLEAARGPLTTATYTVPRPSGYGSGTVTYPTASGSYPGIVLMPGYQGTQQNLQWLAPRLASWGFVVINVGTNTLTDDPESRGRQITAAGTQLLALGNAPGNPLSGKLDGTLGAAGHSMGGGGVMAALRDDPRFRAGVPTAPYHPNGNFSGVTEPTFFLTCQSDSVSHGDRYAVPWYNSMSQAEKLYIEVPGDHLCPMTGYGNKAKQGKWMVSFFSLWLRADTRFSPFLCGPARDADKNNTSLVTRWMDTCQF